LQSPTNPGGFTWDFANNPINGYNPLLSINDPLNQAAIRDNMRRPRFGDFLIASAFLFAVGWGVVAIF
jgi:hypothetical protein